MPKDKSGGANFTGKDGKVYLVRCPKCGLENYAPAVFSGVCVWCGYDGNAKKEKVSDE